MSSLSKSSADARNRRGPHWLRPFGDGPTAEAWARVVVTRALPLVFGRRLAACSPGPNAYTTWNCSTPVITRTLKRAFGEALSQV
jgi:hypothetical protein